MVEWKVATMDQTKGKMSVGMKVAKRVEKME